VEELKEFAEDRRKHLHSFGNLENCISVELSLPVQNKTIKWTDPCGHKSHWSNCHVQRVMHTDCDDIKLEICVLKI